MISPLLTPTEFGNLGKMTGPRNVIARHYDAVESAPSRTVFDVECPPNALLDAEVFVDWTLLVADAAGGDAARDSFGGTQARPAPLPFTPGDDLVAGYLPRVQGKWAPRQGATIAKAMAKVRVWWNGALIEQEPVDFAAIMERFYASADELRNLCSMSGGPLDTGFGTADGGQHRLRSAPSVLGNVAARTVVAVHDWIDQPVDIQAAAPNDHTINVAREIPLVRQTANLGFRERFNALLVRARAQGSPANTVVVTGVDEHLWPPLVELVMRERLPFAPFTMWRSRDKVVSLANARHLRIEITWVSNVHAVLQRDPNLNIAINWTGPLPVLHLKWLYPPASVALPKVVRQPMRYYTVHKKDVSQVLGPLTAAEHKYPTSRTVKFENIVWRNWPEKFFIAVKVPQEQLLAQSPTETHFEILKVSIRLDGIEGKVGEFETTQLYAMFLRNCPVSAHRRLDFEQWQKRWCIVVLTRDDIASDQVVEDGRRMSLELEVQNHWNQPTYYSPVTENVSANFGGLQRPTIYVIGENHFPMVMDKRTSVFMKT